MINMYEILKNLVLMKNTPRCDLEKKIWTSWAAGNLTDDEKDELLQLVFENLSPEAEAPDLAELYKRLSADVEKLKTRVDALKQGTPGEPGSDTVPTWKEWDGITSDYQYGAVVAHSEKYWLNVLKDTQNVWEPGTVDERYWKEISKEDAEAIISGEKTVDDIIGKE